MGEISKDCSDEQLASWSELLKDWPTLPMSRPKQLSRLVKNGIPGIKLCHLMESLIILS